MNSQDINRLLRKNQIFALTLNSLNTMIMKRIDYLSPDNLSEIKFLISLLEEIASGLNPISDDILKDQS